MKYSRFIRVFVDNFSLQTKMNCHFKYVYFKPDEFSYNLAKFFIKNNEKRHSLTWRCNTKQELIVHRSLLKHPCLSKQVILLQSTTLEFEILLRADRKSFLLAHQQTIDVQS